MEERLCCSAAVLGKQSFKLRLHAKFNRWTNRLPPKLTVPIRSSNMRTHGSRPRQLARLRNAWLAFPLLAILGGHSLCLLYAQTPNQESLSEQVKKLTDSMAHAQAQLDEMRQQLLALKSQLAESASTPPAAASPGAPPAPPPSATESTPSATAAAIDELRERQAVLESQVATH